MSRQLLLEGPSIEPLLAKVREDHGSAARIIKAERVRVGGVGGFFAKERFEVTIEVTEDATTDSDGGRWMHTPDLGVFYAQTDVTGNMVVPEDRIRYAMEIAGSNALELHRELRLALGQAWDDELEPFRHAAEGNPVVWLHRVG